MQKDSGEDGRVGEKGEDLHGAATGRIEERPKGPAEWLYVTGAHLENLILSDLLAWRDASIPDRPGLFYWRTATGEEVDFVVERGPALLGVEVKATMRPRLSDARHLQMFRDEYGDSVRGCLLLHGGEQVEWMGPRILAAPWWRVI